MLLDFRNKERTRCTVLRRAGVPSLTVDGVCGGLRRKSVRMSLLGCGSEMFPNEDPLRRRWALRRCAPNRQMLATVRRTPNTRPGKKPTRTAVIGNLSHEAVRGVVLFFAGAEEDVGDGLDCVEAAVEDGDEELDVVGTEFCWSAFITQLPAALQV